MKLKQGVVLLAAMMVVAFLLPNEASAQNPSFAGREFRRVWVGGTVPDGASEYPDIADVFLTSAGVFIRGGTYGNGIYYADDDGAETVALKTQPEFSGTAWFKEMGSMADGGLLFSPVANNNIYPCQVYNANGLNAVASPTPDQSLNLGNYFDGRFVYLEHLGLGKVNIMYYSEGNPAEIWLSNDDFSDLAGILDYDGGTLAFATGTTGAFTLRLRATDGTLTRIIANGDPLPGTVVTTYDNTPGSETVEVDQGKVYLLGVGAGFPVPQALFSTLDGTTYDVIAQTGQVVPGLTGITISGMVLKQVRNGKIWLQVTQSDSDTVLYQIIGSTWTRVAGKSDSYDGRVPVAFDVFEHGTMGDNVVVAATFFDFATAPRYYITDLYVNADLPGFAAGPSGASLQMTRELDGRLTISAVGDVGATNTLQATSSLTNSVWDVVGAVVADGAGRMEWTVNSTNDTRFFRLVE